MIFNRNNNVRSFRLSISPGGTDRLVAFGPGAVISGSVFLTLDKTIQARRLRVVFKCQDRDGRGPPKNIFAVENVIWGGSSNNHHHHHHGGRRGNNNNNNNQQQQLKSGGHMYLFAIKLPNINYPPSVHDHDLVGHRIEYSLQAYLDLLPERTVETSPARVLYLPLVPCHAPASSSSAGGAMCRQVFRRGEHVLETSAQVVKPSYCPGDMCSVKLHIKNRSDYKITTLQVALVARHQRKSYTMNTENLYVSIGKHAPGTDTLCHFTIPPHCIPTSRLSMFDLTYEVVVTIPWMSSLSGWKFPSLGSYSSLASSSSSSSSSTSSSQQSSSSSSSSSSSCVLSLPVTIASVPSTYPVSPHLSLPLPDYDPEGYPILPSFIPNIESPTISPSSPEPMPSRRSSSSPDNLSVSPVDSLDGRTLCDGFDGPGPGTTGRHHGITSNQFLAVPNTTTSSSSSNHPRRRASTSSVATECSAEAGSLFSDSSSHTRVAV